MKQVFSNCFSLKSLPDISKWNTENVIDFSCLFENCISLNKIPDISKWNTNKLKTINRIFYNCSSLISLPDISKWTLKNINNFDIGFNKDSSLEFISFNVSSSKKFNKSLSSESNEESNIKNILIEKEYNNYNEFFFGKIDDDFYDNFYVDSYYENKAK